MLGILADDWTTVTARVRRCDGLAHLTLFSPARRRLKSALIEQPTASAPEPRCVAGTLERAVAAIRGDPR
jgi:hypothetical protein